MRRKAPASRRPTAQRRPQTQSVPGPDVRSGLISLHYLALNIDIRLLPG